MQEDTPKPIRQRGFQKGCKANPYGSKKLPSEVKEAMHLNRESFEKQLQAFLRKPVREIVQILEDREQKSIDALVASIILKAISEGCIIRTTFLLNRMGINPYNIDPMNTIPEILPSETPHYVVEMSEAGKFLRSRPRMIQKTEIFDLQEEKNE